jgi:hypothetical protein
VLVPQGRPGAEAGGSGTTVVRQLATRCDAGAGSTFAGEASITAAQPASTTAGQLRRVKPECIVAKRT